MCDSSQQVSSISEWLESLKAGEADATQKLWNRYSNAIVGLARAHLTNMPTRLVDAEDIATTVFFGLCQGAEAGRFADVRNRDELWWLLMALTRRSCVREYRREKATKRGGGKVISQTEISASEAFDYLVANEPTPEFVAAMNDEFSRLLRLLDDDTLCSIAISRIEGWTVKEIADRFGISMSSLSRKLRLIRDIWRSELDQ